MSSVWTKTADLPRFEQLKGNKKTDVLIIGGGITGILCAYMLQQAGIDYILVEAKRICSGITKNTTAKITSQHGLIYQKVLKQYGLEKTKMYLDANNLALAKFLELGKNIDCNMEVKDSFVYSMDKKIKLEDEMSALEKIGYHADLVEDLPLPITTVGAVKFNQQAQFHPLKFLSQIAEGLNIYEHTKVLEMQVQKAVTEYGEIQAKQIIVTTHFPMLNKHGSYFIKMYQHRSYVLALAHAQNVQGMYVDEAMKGLSFRNYDKLLLLGGGDHRTGKSGGAWNELKTFADRQYPTATEEYRWATQDCMTLDSIPYIGQYSSRTQGLYVATGFNKWGMTSSMAAAIILTDLVQGKENPYAAVFNPSRSIMHPQLAVNSFEAVTNLLTPSKKRCPHLGCALKWNKYEHTWDCPCHGSRFEENGTLIDNPATDDAKKLKNLKN